jgi:hypothetical protein
MPTPEHPERMTSGIRCLASRQPTSRSLLFAVRRDSARSRRESCDRGARLSPSSASSSL